MKRKRTRNTYFDNDEDPYVPSGSEDEYSESEKILLEKVTKEKNAALEESEEEIYGLGDEVSDDEDGKGKMSDSDIEGKEDEDDDLPDVRAWGKKRKNFYRTDYVDEDYGGYDEKDMEAAEQEEEEARAIQKRLVEQLDDADFSLDIFSEKVEKEAEPQEVIKTDLGKMSKRQKLALMQKESPEFFGLIEDFKTSMLELQNKLEPMLKLIKEGKITASPADDYVRTKYHILLNYCTNITFYLLLKAKQISVQSHPVIRRLYQFRQLLKQLESVDQVVMPQIEFILEQQQSMQQNVVTKKSKKKMLKLLSQLKEDHSEEEEEKDHSVEIKTVSKTEINKEENMEDSAEENEDSEKEEEKEGKRGITYQIAKNKGLTPHRKKENRNPRVKHRNKFRKAKIRRKGQVREPRKELAKYGGEISGIKIGVVKSVKLK